MYYPQSQIKTNLYTNGGEFVIKATNKNYVGPYWTTSSGQFFTKKTPQDTPYEELIKSTTTIIPPNYSSVSILGIKNTGSIDDSRFDYDTVKAYDLARGIDIYNPKIKKTPQYYFPQPTQDDYNLGSFTRYLCKRTNQNIYIEINKDTYNGLKDSNPAFLFSLYTPFTITWTLTGPSMEEVEKINLQVTSLKEQQLKFRGLVKYFKYYNQFYKPN